LSIFLNSYSICAVFLEKLSYKYPLRKYTQHFYTVYAGLKQIHEINLNVFFFVKQAVFSNFTFPLKMNLTPGQAFWQLSTSRTLCLINFKRYQTH